ncbi:MAG: hypothetical protein GYB31_14430 [Bacteroidetes bacterium]|nr:hypothetical protein [Bacteroidota bacterium]
MRYIALILLLTVSSLAVAQSDTEYVYCEAQPNCLGIPNFFELFVDLGVRQSGVLNNRIAVRDLSDNSKLRFKSRMHALRFMTSRGWELVEVITIGESAQPVYLMRYPVAGESEKDFVLREAFELYGEDQ